MESRAENLSEREERSQECSDLLRNEVFTIMTADEIGRTAQKVDLIVALGESWIRRNISNTKKGNIIPHKGCY